MPREARPDLRGSIGWIVFGAAVLSEAWRMDRLGSLGINPLSAPGLMPGLLGALMVVFGGALGLRALAQSSDGGAEPSGEGRRIALALALCVGYAAGLLGKGLPFWLTSGAFLVAAILVFRLLDHDAESGVPLRRVVLSTLAIAFGSSIVIALLFQEVFLVRLP